MIWKLEALIKTATTTAVLPARGTAWVPARPITARDCPIQERLRGAWGVLTGRLDAVRWPAGQ